MYSARVVQVLPRRQLMMRSRVVGHQKSTVINWESSSKLILLKTTWEFVKGLNTDHSAVILHLKQIGKVKKLDKWVPHELTANKEKKSLFWSVIFFYSTQQQTISQSDCDLWQKVDFIQQPETTNLVVGLKSSFKAHPKAKLAPKEVMVSVWGSAAALIHYSFLNPGATVKSEKYAQYFSVGQ